MKTFLLILFFIFVYLTIGSAIIPLNNDEDFLLVIVWPLVLFLLLSISLGSSIREFVKSSFKKLEESIKND